MSMFEDLWGPYSDLVKEFNEFEDEYVERDEDEKRFRYKLPCAPKYVLRRGVKLWKTNRAIYRPYAGLL